MEKCTHSELRAYCKRNDGCRDCDKPAAASAGSPLMVQLIELVRGISQSQSSYNPHNNCECYNCIQRRHQISLVERYDRGER